MTFKSGDIVEAKAGGPLMDVDEVHSEEVICSYFGPGQVRLKATFKAATLKHYDPRDCDIPTPNLGVA